MTGAQTLPLREFVEADTTRLISTAYIDEPALTPLVDDAEELAFLEELEGLTSSRRGLPEFIPHGVRPDELLNESHGYGWTYVNAAFCYTRETGSRFNGPERGAWYSTWGKNQIETAQSEVAWHLIRELEATGIFENVTTYRELNASFATKFHNLEGQSDHPALKPDIEIGHQEGQKLAAQLMGQNSNGILYPSVRKQGGWCLAAFRPNLVQNIRQGKTWHFEWSGDPQPTITPLG